VNPQSKGNTKPGKYYRKHQHKLQHKHKLHHKLHHKPHQVHHKQPHKQKKHLHKHKRQHLQQLNDFVYTDPDKYNLAKSPISMQPTNDTKEYKARKEWRTQYKENKRLSDITKHYNTEIDQWYLKNGLWRVRKTKKHPYPGI
jgi:hypothetical protein